MFGTDYMNVAVSVYNDLKIFVVHLACRHDFKFYFHIRRAT